MAADWRSWRVMARDSLTAAKVLHKEHLFRASASRAYYAAYLAVSAVNIYIGRSQPPAREAWSHEDTPRMIMDHWQRFVASSAKRRDLARRLGLLYKLRISSDYFGQVGPGEGSTTKALRDATVLVKTAERILPLR